MRLTPLEFCRVIYSEENYNNDAVPGELWYAERCQHYYYTL